jgi:hypothetical protein
MISKETENKYLLPKGMGGKFDDRGRNAEAISRYVEEYVKREKDS